jgi:hypothetical protein
MVARGQVDTGERIVISERNLIMTLGFKNIPIRFFIWDETENDAPDLLGALEIIALECSNQEGEGYEVIKEMAETAIKKAKGVK